jgi:hypothetical protein
VSIRSGQPQADGLDDTVFVESLSWFSGYFVVSLVVVCLIHRLRFGARNSSKF